ncbi:hypothetical protein KP79_PYT13025 [Mizuhopecten yessoensis]|uniref:SGNH hydrolase-type esterase domain-containing protein n=1 Tax=Mizuhopecten yessoensis TaxID=6573 RepID=A0A210Q8A9_MIZYE|nr:hypothetical protein KP79_PYT13025 [Mizuhopecten yessoensis]
MLRVAVVGSSHVRHMDHNNEFIYGTSVTKYFWKSGGIVEQMYSFMSVLRNYGPQVIFLQIGGNDIVGSTSPERLADDIFRLCRDLLCGISGLQCVVVGSLFVRLQTRGVLATQYEFLRQRVNNCLASQSCNRVVFWWHKRLIPSCLAEDGVHLNVRGNVRLFMSMRAAVIVFSSGQFWFQS